MTEHSRQLLRTHPLPKYHLAALGVGLAIIVLSACAIIGHSSPRQPDQGYPEAYAFTACLTERGVQAAQSGGLVGIAGAITDWGFIELNTGIDYYVPMGPDEVLAPAKREIWRTCLAAIPNFHQTP